MNEKKPLIHDLLWRMQWQYFSDRPIPAFAVDTCVSRCYKLKKDKLFGGESPIELRRAVRE